MLFAWGAGVDPVMSVLSGGVMLGAIFMATDYVTSPITPVGRIVFGIIIGILTAIFRIFGPSAEGVSFAILLMNILTPLITKLTTAKPFGWEGKADEK